MIQQVSFLGISLRTAARRRALVLGYCFLLIAFASVPLCLHRPITLVMLMQTFTWASLLGGIRIGGPVKLYDETIDRSRADASKLTQLNLAERVQQTISPLLTQAEVQQRNHAHYTAFRILRWSLSILTILYWTADKFAPSLVANNSSTLLWLLLMYVLSLPQSVILWTEPEPLAEASLTLVHP